MAIEINGDGLIRIDGTSTTQGRVRLAEDSDNGTNYVELQAPASLAANLTLTLPSADGTNGQALITNGSGALSFGIAAINGVFYENNQSVTTNYTISTNKNAMSAGPVSINSGVTVTIPTGSFWTIV